MGLLDGLVGQVVGQVLGGGQQGSNPLMGILQSLIEKNGGIGGLLQQFQKGGLGDAAASWVSTGSNLPISADQIASVLGGSGLGELAAKFGISPEQANGGLADLLPQVIDKLTPNGKVENDSPSLDLGSILGSLMK
jgi:uncharacterized protein YidB (DUF937 family)